MLAWFRLLAIYLLVVSPWREPRSEDYALSLATGSEHFLFPIAPV
jgi:hypothetical protein